MQLATLQIENNSKYITLNALLSTWVTATLNFIIETIYYSKMYIYFFVAGLRKVYPYYFTFTTFTKGRWVGEKILDVFAREFRAHPAEEYVSLV